MLKTHTLWAKKNKIFAKSVLLLILSVFLSECLWAGQAPSSLEPIRTRVLSLRYVPAEKVTEFLSELKSLGRKQLLVTGIETHVCVYQTVATLLELGYDSSSHYESGLLRPF